jgi:hypothetical protein
MIRLRRFSLLFALAVFAAACADSAGSGGIVSRIDLAGLPPTAKFYVGQSLPLRANVYDAQDNLLTDVTVAWTSSDTSIAVVGSSGLHVGLLGKAPGPVTITATSQGRDTVAHLTVVIVRADSVDVAPHLPAGYVGMTIPLSARTLDSIGGVLADRPPHWTSSKSARRRSVPPGWSRPWGPARSHSRRRVRVSPRAPPYCCWPGPPPIGAR